MHMPHLQTDQGQYVSVGVGSPTDKSSSTRNPFVGGLKSAEGGDSEPLPPPEVSPNAVGMVIEVRTAALSPWWSWSPWRILRHLT